MRLDSKFGRLTRAAMVAVSTLSALPALADRVLLGSDYLHTVAPTSFAPIGNLASAPIGPGNTDTIVRRLGNCDLVLATAGSQCTIPIELVALSLFSTTNPLIRVRESPTLASPGSMTITSDGSGTGGTFSSFFDIFFELSFDGGSTFSPGGDLVLSSSSASWSTLEQGLLVNGLIGNVSANRHTDKGTACPLPLPMKCVDFYIPQVVTHLSPTDIHSVMSAVPEPGGLALAALGLLLMAGLAQHGLRPRH